VPRLAQPFQAAITARRAGKALATISWGSFERRFLQRPALDEHAGDVERLKTGDTTALEDLLEACTGAKVRTVTVRHLV
jgi:hypothetical protein